MFCKKCGAKLDDGAKFCPSCGEAMSAPEQEPQKEDFAQKVKDLNNTPDTTADYAAEDIANNKVMALFAYLGLLWLIPFFACKQSPYAQYHCKQGFILMLADVAYAIVSIVLTAVIKVPRYVWGIYVGSYTPGWLPAILALLSLPLIGLAVLGIINAVTGKAKELPIIGKYKLLK